MKAQIAQLEREKEKNSVIFTFIADSVSGFDGQPNEIAINVGKRAANIAMAIEEPESDFLQCWTEEVNSRDYFRGRTYGVLEQCIDKVKNEDVAEMLINLDEIRESSIMTCGDAAESRAEQAVHCHAKSSHRFILAAHRVFFNLITDPEYIKNKTISFDTLDILENSFRPN